MIINLQINRSTMVENESSDLEHKWKIIFPAHIIGYCCACGHVTRTVHETAEWVSSKEDIAMATGFLDTIVLPVDYLLCIQEVAKFMDRFIPSSKQPQHWSRNYNNSQDRRRSLQKGVSEPEPKSFGGGPGVLLRAEDLLRSGDRGATKSGELRVGGSAVEGGSRPSRPPLRRASEGALPRSSSSSSNEPSSSPSSDTSSSSSSSSSESGCNADSETCSYCRLSESSDSTESSPPPEEQRRPRRTSPGEYLRHKRTQMERMKRSESHSPSNKNQRCERRPSMVCEDAVPFLECGVLRCVVCDEDLPVAQTCVLCCAQPHEMKQLDAFYDAPTGNKVPVSSPRGRKSLSEDGDGLTTPQLRKSHSEPTDNTESSGSSSSGRRTTCHVVKDSPRKLKSEESVSSENSLVVGTPEVRKSPVFLKPEFDFEPEIIHKANPLVDEAEVGSVVFRRLSEDEFLSTLNIHEAARKGDLHVVKLLTKKEHKHMETVDERGWTPIHLAAAHGHKEVVKYLASEGAHLAALDPSSYTALHLAAMNGHTNCLEVLLPMGISIDGTTAEGFTPLHLAVMNGHVECIRLLLMWGANVGRRDNLGRGVTEMVEEYGLEEVATLLRSFRHKMHDFKHMLHFFNGTEDTDSSDIPPEYMEILASIAEENATD